MRPLKEISQVPRACWISGHWPCWFSKPDVLEALCLVHVPWVGVLNMQPKPLTPQGEAVAL